MTKALLERLADTVVDAITKAIEGPKVAGRIDALEKRNKELEARILELEAQAAARDGVPR
jgi:hypothetical protein